MEGRTIARPDPCVGPLEVRGTASMEGRTIARPDPAVCACGRSSGLPASMEGRTIARPDWRRDRPAAVNMNRLQWRAGQLPGQTGARRRGSRAAQVASMEGRTIARPDDASSMSTPTVSPSLQWRAGQLPGQTPPGRPWRSACLLRFNGGPDNCPARPDAARSRDCTGTRFNGGPDNCPARPGRQTGQPRRRHSASMEGRTIARPDFATESPSTEMPKLLQWRAGQLPGQTVLLLATDSDEKPLQWRAGQLPGQTTPACTTRPRSS